MDGSPYCFYLRLNSPSSKWAIYFEGRGACENEQSCCVERSDQALGSSTNLAPTKKPFVVGDWNMIHLPYSDGSERKGAITKPRTVTAPAPPPKIPGSCGSFAISRSQNTVCADSGTL